MVSFSTRYTPEQEARINAESRDRLRYEVKALEKQVKKLKAEIEQLKNANQEVAYWKDVAESLQEYIDIMEE